MTPDMTNDAQTRPLGAYFRVNHKDLVAMHSAIAEVGTLYATARVHEGWRRPGTKGLIKQSDQMIGGHAFAIVAFDAEGFWIQNSWGTDWGLDGFGRVSYDDWLTNGSDVWVARLGAPIHVHAGGLAVTKSGVSGSTESVGIADLRPHIVSLGNDGRLRPGGAYGTNEADVAAVFDHFKERSKTWTKKRLLLYAHGGLVPEASAIQRLADYRKALLDQEVYPISFIWHSDFMSVLVDILQDVLNRRAPEGFIDRAKDFMLDRLDDLLEPVARAIGGKAQWDQMKQNAIGATTLDETDDQGKRTRGGAWIALEHIANLMQSDPTVEVHVVGHSAGAIFQGPIVKLLTSKGTISGGILDGETGYGLKVATVTMWAPACTIDLFKGCYLPAIKSRSIGKFALFDLSDPTEQDDDCKGIYHKSLLYLVSNAFEATQRVPWSGQPGTPLLGMEKFVKSDPEIAAAFVGRGHRADLVLSPNTNDPEKGNGSTSQHHGGFDSDSATVRSTFKRVVGEFDASRRMRLAPLGAELRDRRQSVAAVRR